MTFHGWQGLSDRSSDRFVWGIGFPASKPRSLVFFHVLWVIVGKPLALAKGPLQGEVNPWSLDHFETHALSLLAGLM